MKGREKGFDLDLTDMKRLCEECTLTLL